MFEPPFKTCQTLQIYWLHCISELTFIIKVRAAIIGSIPSAQFCHTLTPTTHTHKYTDTNICIQVYILIYTQIHAHTHICIQSLTEAHHSPVCGSQYGG